MAPLLLPLSTETRVSVDKGSSRGAISTLEVSAKVVYSYH